MIVDQLALGAPSVPRTALPLKSKYSGVGGLLLIRGLGFPPRMFLVHRTERPWYYLGILGSVSIAALPNVVFFFGVYVPGKTISNDFVL